MKMFHVIEDTVDDETEDWPVSDRLPPDLNEIKFEYRVVPLPARYSNFVLSRSGRSLSDTGQEGKCMVRILWNEVMPSKYCRKTGQTLYILYVRDSCNHQPLDATAKTGGSAFEKDDG